MATVTKVDSSVIPKLSQGPKQETKLSFVNFLDFINYLWIIVTYIISSRDQHVYSPVAAAK